MSDAKQALDKLRNRQKSLYTNQLQKGLNAVENQPAFYGGIDSNGRHYAIKPDESIIYAPQENLITGGAIELGQIVNAVHPIGGSKGFIDGQQRG